MKGQKEQCVQSFEERGSHERNERNSTCLKPGTSERKVSRDEIREVNKDHIKKFGVSRESH